MTASTNAAPSPCTRSGSGAATSLLRAAARLGRTHRHGSVTTEDFILAARRVTGIDAEAVLHPWLYEEALPPLPAG